MISAASTWTPDCAQDLADKKSEEVATLVDSHKVEAEAKVKCCPVVCHSRTCIPLSLLIS